MNGSELTKTETATLVGTFGFTGTAGGFSCGVKTEVEFGPGSAASVKSFSFPTPSGCKFTGGLAAVCGEKLSSHSITGLPGAFEAEGSGETRTARITGVGIDLTASGSFCPTITLSGGITATPDDPTQISEFELSGSLSSNLGSAISATGSLVVFGSSGTYGIKEAATPPTRTLRHEGVELPEAVTAVSHGSFGFSLEFGGFACDTTMSMHLEPPDTGTVTSFAPSATATCAYTGQMDNLCGAVDTHSATGLPWTLHTAKFADGSYGFRISGFHVDFGGTGIFCPDMTFRGEPVLKGNPHELSMVTMSGDLHSNLGTPALPISGGQSLTPAKTFGVET